MRKLLRYAGSLWTWLLRLLAWLLLVPIRFYQIAISPLLGPSYARQAIVTHGPFKGLWLAVRRLLRCHPWGGSGYDPVP